MQDHGTVQGYGSSCSTPASLQQASNHHFPPSTSSGTSQYYNSSVLCGTVSEADFEEDHGHMHREYKYSTPLRSSEFQYLNDNGSEVPALPYIDSTWLIPVMFQSICQGTSIHTSALFQTNTSSGGKANRNNWYFRLWVDQVFILRVCVVAYAPSLNEFSRGVVCTM